MQSPFEFQMEILKVELDQINSAIRQMDDITKNIKDWAIVTWTLSLGTTLATASLHSFIGFTAIIPLVFWLIDARYRQIQRRFIYRIRQISDFLNDTRLRQSFDEQQLIGFQVLDPMAIKSRGNPDYESYVSLFRTLRFGSVLNLYLSLILISMVVHLIFHNFIF